MAKTRGKAAKNIFLVESKSTSFNPDVFTEQAITKENVSMPKGKKTPTNEKSVYVKFTEREDHQKLYSILKSNADADERELGQYIVRALLQAFEPQTSEPPELQFEAAGN